MIPPGATRIAPGIYELGEELHVDLEEFVLNAGGDPTSDRDRATALHAIERVFAGIPAEVREK